MISLFLSWFGEISAWEGYDLTDIVLAAIAVLAIVVGASIATGNALNVPSGPGGALTTAGLLAFGMVATWVIEGEEKKFGLFLALIATAAIIYAGLQIARGGGTAPPRRTTTEAPPPPPPPASPTV